MIKLFTQTAEHTTTYAVGSDFFEKLPGAIRKHSDWNYTVQQRNTGCFLKPTFRDLPYRNSFVPEINVTVSFQGEHTVLHMTGQPVKLVRVFNAVWFGFLLVMEMFCIGLAVASGLDSPDLVIGPIVMYGLNYLLCKVATKATFHSVVKAIQKEFPNQHRQGE